MTGEQHAEWGRVVELEAAGRDEETARWRRIRVAAQAPGFAGALRRAALDAGRSLNEIASAAKIEPQNLIEWMEGNSSLSVDDVERLVDALGLRLGWPTST